MLKVTVWVWVGEADGVTLSTGPEDVLVPVSVTLRVAVDAVEVPV